MSQLEQPGSVWEPPCAAIDAVTLHIEAARGTAQEAHPMHASWHARAALIDAAPHLLKVTDEINPTLDRYRRALELIRGRAQGPREHLRRDVYDIVAKALDA